MTPVDNIGGLVPRPSDVVASVPGVGESATELQRRFEGAVDGVATGTPPVAGTSGVGVVSGTLSTGRGLAAAVGSAALQNTGAGREALDLGNAAAGGNLNDLPAPSGDDGGLSVPWVPIAAFLALLVGINALAGGLAEGVTS